MSNYTNFVHYNISFPQPSIAHVEINRPDKLNAFIQPMWEEYRDIFNLLSADANVRAVIFSGAGPRAFTAGLDIRQASSILGGSSEEEEEELDPARRAWKIRKSIKDFQDAIGAMERCEKPVILLFHGISYGLAIDVGCCADIRLCTASTQFSIKEVDIGLAADIGTLSRLPKIVGSLSWVKEVALTARVFSGEEALRQGFVSGVFEDKEKGFEAALRIATEIAAKSPVAVQGTKEIVNYSVGRNVEDGLLYTQSWNAAAIQTADVPEAIKANLQKRNPKFSKL
ncbi:hypothetical protein RUND412_002843 [Rhizina undulata]